MNWLNSLYYIIPALFILLLILPILFEVRACYNPMLNRGVIALFVFKINVFYYIFSLKGRYLELKNKEGTKLQKLEFSSQKFAVMESFMQEIKEKIKLKKLYVFYNIGLGDAFVNAMFCGVLNEGIRQAFLQIKNKKPTASLCIYDTVSYNSKVFELAVVGQVSISFFDVAYSYLYSVIITKKNKTSTK